MLVSSILSSKKKTIGFRVDDDNIITQRIRVSNDAPKNRTIKQNLRDALESAECEDLWMRASNGSDRDNLDEWACDGSFNYTEYEHVSNAWDRFSKMKSRWIFKRLWTFKRWVKIFHPNLIVLDSTITGKCSTDWLHMVVVVDADLYNKSYTESPYYLAKAKAHHDAEYALRCVEAILAQDWITITIDDVTYGKDIAFNSDIENGNTEITYLITYQTLDYIQMPNAPELGDTTEQYIEKALIDEYGDLKFHWLENTDTLRL